MTKRAFSDDLLWSTLLVEGVGTCETLHIVCSELLTKFVGGGDEFFK